VDTWIAGTWVATILCAQATCERTLAGMVSLNALPGAGIKGPKQWERMGAGKLLQHVREQHWVPDGLIDDVNRLIEVRKPYGHWRGPVDENTIGGRMGEELLNEDDLNEDSLINRLLSKDAYHAASTALKLYFGGYGKGPYETD
jgi:hypothetical protein